MLISASEAKALATPKEPTVEEVLPYVASGIEQAAKSGTFSVTFSDLNGFILQPQHTVSEGRPLWLRELLIAVHKAGYKASIKKIGGSPIGGGTIRLLVSWA